ncbi:unnamed protein product [Paramecium sonneborni]|uniref:Intimal thickness related receptor IRP domain-containing protein n=1 Tax=Paramecium sonneborni TaxID=65129 RepID=A0A8S1NAA2_9CILI|nr:unnamed protein product [Paramecium sonneborni]
MYILLLYLPLLLIGQEVQIYIEDDSDQYTVYDNNKIQFEFLPENLNQGMTCKPPRSFGVTNQRDVIGYSNQTLKIVNNDIVTYKVLVNQKADKNTNITLSTQVLSDDDALTPKDQLSFLLSQKCPQKYELTGENYWTSIKVIVNLIEANQETPKEIEFAMIFSCDKSFRQLTFDWSLPILLVISTILIAFLAKYTRILSFRWKRNGQDFQGFEINFIVICIYILAYAAGGILVVALDYQDIINYFFIIIACSIGTLAVFFVTAELSYLFKASSFVRQYYLIFSSIISLMIGLPYYFLKPWYLSDIISLAFIFLIVKFFRLKNLKNAAIMMLANIILDSTFAIAIHYTQVESYNTAVLQYLNCPLELQLPLMKLQYNKNCAWISLFSQAIPGLFLSLAYRIDKSKRTFTYGLSGFLSLIAAEGLWILTTVSVKHSIPETVFTYPVLLIVLCVNSLRRAEFKSFLYGDYLIDQSHYRLRGESYENFRAPQSLLNMESIPDSKIQPTDL